MVFFPFVRAYSLSTHNNADCTDFLRFRQSNSDIVTNNSIIICAGIELDIRGIGVIF